MNKAMAGKLKVHSGAAKRFRKTGGGLKRKRAFRSHILTKMTAKRKRHLRGTSTIVGVDRPAVNRLLRRS